MPLEYHGHTEVLGLDGRKGQGNRLERHSYLTLPTPLKDLFTSNDFVIRTFIVSRHILQGIAWAK